MEKTRHPNIVQFLGVATAPGTPPELCIILEYCERGSLWQILHDRSVELKWHNRQRMAMDIAKAVLYLHTCHDPPILHRDLKSLNIVLDRACNAKLADFGWTRKKSK